MFYKPVFCCECGEKIERLSDSLLSASKFCDVCKPNFKFENAVPRGIVGFGVLGLVFGFSGFFQKNVKPDISVKKSEIASVATMPKPVVDTKPKPTPAVVSAEMPIPSAKVGTNQPIPSLEKKVSTVENTVSQTSREEPSYFCGAKTKKGTPCSRKVKGAVRCWQHLGEPAMLPPNKLIASQ